MLGVEGVEGGVGAATLRAKLKEKLARLRDSMLAGLVDRDEPARLLLAAMLAGEHMLLIGPPGTAKSELARRLHGVVGGAYFERLLTRFSVPEELFGPLSLRELDNDRYVRRVEGFLPSASVAFVDEVFKANSAILNALLTILNERLFDNGATREPVPLVSLVGASNELPTGDELAALYDRFLVRYQVGSVTAERFMEMALATESAWSPPPESERLTDAELNVIRDAARTLPVAPDVADLLRSLRDEGRVMLVSTHNLGSVPEFCDRAILLNRTVLAAGLTHEVFTRNNLEAAFGGVLRHFVLGGSALHDDADAREVTVLTDDERPFVIYGDQAQSASGPSPATADAAPDKGGP